MVRIKIFLLIIGVLSVFLMGKNAQAAVVKPMNLEEIITTAHYIFSGICISVDRRYDDVTDRDGIFYTFSVSKIIKGEESSEFTFKMSSVASDLGQVPTFKPGEEVVLFLYGKSTQGFTSPVGLGLGKFTVLRSPSGEKVVVNAHNNTDLFKDMNRTKYSARFPASHAAEISNLMGQQSGAINYDLFLTFLEEMVH